MELSLREWLIIGGVVIIALIIIDGWRRMRSNRNTLRMQIDKSLVDIPEESHNPELPNGGFRVIDDDTAEPVVGQSPVSLASEVESELPRDPDEETAEETSVQPGELASEVNTEVDNGMVSAAVVRQESFSMDVASSDQSEFDDDNLSAPRIVTAPDSSQEEPQPAFSDIPEEAEVNFESVSDVRYAAEFEVPQASVPQALTSEEPAVTVTVAEPYIADEPVPFSATEQALSDEQVSVAFGSGPSAESDNNQPAFENDLSRDTVEDQPAFDANDFAERDPLFEPIGDVDDGLSDYDGLSDVRIVSEPAAFDYAYDQAGNAVAESDETVNADQAVTEAGAEPVYTYAQPSEDVADVSDTDLSSSAEPSVSEQLSEQYQYDDLDDDLSQGAEDFISPRLTEVVEEDDQDTGLDFEKPITELFGHPQSHAVNPEQATMDLGEADEFFVPQNLSEPEPVEPAVPVSRFGAVDDESFDEEISHAPLIGESISEPSVEHYAGKRQEPTFTDLEPEPMYTDPLEDMTAAPDDFSPEEPEEPEQESSVPVAASSQPEPQKRSMQSVPDADKVLVISVVTREEQGFNGRNLLQIVKACGMHFGEMQIFNRYEDGIDQGAIQFSMTNAMEPGVFDIDNMESLDTRGVTFFMSMEEPRDVMNAYECMLGTAEAVAKNLGGELLDENRSSMRTQTKEHYRERIRNFEMRKLKPQL